jgi:hypothetical protein
MKFLINLNPDEMSEFREDQELLAKIKGAKFRTGDVVYLKSDTKRIRPFNVKLILPLSLEETYQIFTMDDTGQLLTVEIYEENLAES